MTHTKGPWEVEKHERMFLIIGNDDCPRNEKMPVCELDRGLSEETDEEQEANARLISAAPELLEALEGLYDEVIAICNDGTLDGSFVETRRSIIATRRAIAKAKGE